MDVLNLVARACVIRQHEGLRAHVDAVKRGQGHATAALVRPAIEELITLRYLPTIPEEDAKTFINLLVVIETANAINMQQQHLGARAMKRLGFSRQVVNDAQKRLRRAETEMVLLAERHKWRIEDAQGRRRSYGPTIPQMAAATDSQALYQFFYSAASRLVHFSPAELLRRAWFSDSRTGTSVTSQNFERYWADFGLTWGAELLVQTMIVAFEILDVSDLEVPESVPEAIFSIFEDGRVPIVTTSELNLG